jgi:endogenous inhibitor of DNA gyrase (YacG/DUF329 family)
MEGEGLNEWPELPFCSRRCKTIDLGRWLGEQYGLPKEEAAPEELSESAEEGP